MNKSEMKAMALEHLGEIVLVVATLAAAIGLNHTFPTPVNDLQMAVVVAVAFVVYQTLANLLTGALGPVIDRLRGIEGQGEDAPEVEK